MHSMKIENQERQRKELEASCASMAKVIGDCIPKGVGFALIFADFGDVGNAAYCSNTDREDMISLLRETANRIEGVGN